MFQSSEFKVGLLVLTVSVLVAVMSMQVSNDPGYLGSTKRAWFMIDDASGLVKNSTVKMAGISVGIIKDIRLEGRRARVTITIIPEVELTESASIEIRANGILGDKHVEVIGGDPRDPKLPDGGQIFTVSDKGSLDSLMKSVGNIASSLGDVAETIKTAIADGDRRHSLGRVVDNIEKLTGDLAEMTSENKGDIRDIVTQVKGITSTLDNLMNDESDEGFKASWRKAVASISRIDKTLKNVEEITDKVNRGEGTIGRLINDETTVEELNTAIEGVNGFLDTADKLQTSIDFNSAYLANVNSAKTSVGLIIQPGMDRFYEIRLIDDPQGVSETVETKTTASGVTSEVSETKKYANKTKYTVLFGKNFYDFSVRGGLIESTGGFGLDYHLFRKKLRLSMEFLKFSSLNVRAYARYKFFKGVYVEGGVDDALNKGSSYSNYLGAGLFLTNDDLKLMLSRMPF